MAKVDWFNRISVRYKDGGTADYYNMGNFWEVVGDISLAGSSMKSSSRMSAEEVQRMYEKLKSNDIEMVEGWSAD